MARLAAGAVRPLPPSSNVGGDIRNALTVARCNVQMALENLPPSSPLRAYLDRAERAILEAGERSDSISTDP